MAFYKKNKVAKEKTEKKDRTNQIITIILGALMVVSVLGYMWTGNSNSTSNYGKYKFEQTSQGWQVKINGNNHYFYYHPSQIEQISLENSTIAKIKSSPQIYITYNPANSYPDYIDLTRFEIANTLLENDIYIKNAAITNYSNMEIASCESNKTLMIMQLEESNETKITDNGNCIKLQASSGMDFLALKDRMLYGIYGII